MWNNGRDYRSEREMLTLEKLKSKWIFVFTLGNTCLCLKLLHIQRGKIHKSGKVQGPSQTEVRLNYKSYKNYFIFHDFSITISSNM